jgi:agmatinase
VAPISTDFDPDGPGTDGLFGLPSTEHDAKVVVIPVPFEATASYRKGTAGAPEAVAEASLQVDLHHHTIHEPWREGIAFLDETPGGAGGPIPALQAEAAGLAAPILEAGEVQPEHAAAQERVNAIGAEVNTWVKGHAKRLLDAGRIPAVLGGDHSVPFGAIQAAAEKHPGLGILHIDAHADLREAYMGFTWSHASIMYNVRQRVPQLGHIVQVGIRDFGAKEAERIEEWSQVTSFTDHEIAWELASGEPWMRIAARIVRRLPKKVWVSFDIDGFDPSLCPNTGTPVPGGPSWRQIQLLLQLLTEEHTIVGFDLCEVGEQPFDASVGARMLYSLATWAIHTHRS